MVNLAVAPEPPLPPPPFVPALCNPPPPPAPEPLHIILTILAPLGFIQVCQVPPLKKPCTFEFLILKI